MHRNVEEKREYLRRIDDTRTSAHPSSLVAPLRSLYLGIQVRLLGDDCGRIRDEQLSGQAYNKNTFTFFLGNKET